MNLGGKGIIKILKTGFLPQNAGSGVRSVGFLLQFTSLMIMTLGMLLNNSEPLFPNLQNRLKLAFMHWTFVKIR